MSSSEADPSDVIVKHATVLSNQSVKRQRKKKQGKDIASQHVENKLYTKQSKSKHKSSRKLRDQGIDIEMNTSKLKKSLKQQTQLSSRTSDEEPRTKKMRVELDSDSESSESDVEKDDEKDDNIIPFTSRKQKEKDEEYDYETFQSKKNIDPVDDEYTAIREELSHMSFEELHKLRDRLGVKVYNQVMQGGSKNDDFSSGKKFSRENKNRPMEMSSKKRVSAFRDIVHVKKKVTRDPRFDDMSGAYNETMFKTSYAFLDDVKKREREKLSKQLRKAKTSEQKQNLQFLINRMGQQESADKQKKTRKDLEKKWKKKELSQVEGGKNPYFLKKGDLLKLELAERYKELKKSGRLEKYLGKKRKKNASKQKKNLPM